EPEPHATHVPLVRRIVGSSAETRPPAGCRTRIPSAPARCSYGSRLDRRISVRPSRYLVTSVMSPGSCGNSRASRPGTAPSFAHRWRGLSPRCRLPDVTQALRRDSASELDCETDLEVKVAARDW